MFEVLSRKLPFGGQTSEEKLNRVAQQAACSKFTLDPDLLEDEGVDEEQQRKRWARRRERTYGARRPDLALVPKEAPPRLVMLMKMCWGDDPDSRPVEIPIATENLLENTAWVGALHQCSLGGGGTLLPSICADARYTDAVIVSQAGVSKHCGSHANFTLNDCGLRADATNAAR